MGTTIIVSITSASCITCHRLMLPSNLFTYVKSQSLQCVHTYLSNIKRTLLGLGRSLVRTLLCSHFQTPLHPQVGALLRFHFQSYHRCEIVYVCPESVRGWMGVGGPSLPYSCYITGKSLQRRQKQPGTVFWRMLRLNPKVRLVGTRGDFREWQFLASTFSV